MGEMKRLLFLLPLNFNWAAVCLVRILNGETFVPLFIEPCTWTLNVAVALFHLTKTPCVGCRQFLSYYGKPRELNTVGRICFVSVLIVWSLECFRRSRTPELLLGRAYPIICFRPVLSRFLVPK